MKRDGEWVIVGLGLTYVKECGQWRILTKEEEGEHLDVTYNRDPNGPTMFHGLFSPWDAMGEDGNFYTRIYPLDTLSDAAIAEIT